MNLRRVNSVSFFNGEPYIYIPDTLYNIKEKEARKALVIDKGSYKIPEEVEADVARKEEWNKYIWGDYGYLTGDYFFWSFIYNKKTYFDLWDISKFQLIARRTVNDYSSPRGIPFDISGHTIYIWPNYVSYNKMYCVLDIEQTLLLLPGYDTDNNSVIVEITLDERKL